MSEDARADDEAAGTTVYAALTAFLRGQSMIFREEPAKGRVHFEYATGDEVWTTFAVAFEEDQQIALYGVVPFSVSEARRPAALELVTRINYGQVIGNFELDLDDGELRFKTSLDFDGAELTAALLRQLFAANVAVMSHYMPTIHAVCLDDRTVAEALAAASSS